MSETSPPTYGISIWPPQFDQRGGKKLNCTYLHFKKKKETIPVGRTLFLQLPSQVPILLHCRRLLPRSRHLTTGEEQDNEETADIGTA